MVPRRKLGKTGLSVSILGLGGGWTIEKPERAEEAEQIINRSIDLGVNYIDTAPTYNAGGSESNIGRVMEYRRDEVLLASKTLDRSYDGTMKLLEQSLKRLHTDYLDLYQVHNVRTPEDLKGAFAANGAVKALEELKNQKVIRFAGITGHRDPDILLRGIKEYPFDCILMFLNAADIHYYPFQNKLLEEAVRQNMGIIAMKVTSEKRIFRDDGITSMKQALNYVYSLPVSMAIVGTSNMAELEENVRIANEFEPLPEAEMKRLELLTEPYASEPNYTKYYK